MQGNGMLIQGWERPLAYDQADTDHCKQEWSVKLLTGAPAVPPPSERLA